MGASHGCTCEEEQKRWCHLLRADASNPISVIRFYLLGKGMEVAGQRWVQEVREVGEKGCGKSGWWFAIGLVWEDVGVKSADPVCVPTPIP